MENCVYYYTSVFVSVRFCSVPFCVPFFVCCSLGNSEKKTEMHLFIAGQHAMQACRAARQPGRQTDLHWVPWTFWIIDHNIHSKQTDRPTDIHMYLSTSDLTQELVKILSDLCWLTSLRTKWKHTFPKTHFSPMWPQIKKLLNINYKFQYHSIWQLSLSSTRDTNVHPR